MFTFMDKALIIVNVSISHFILRAVRRLKSEFVTHALRKEAIFGKHARMGPDGSIFNIRGQRDSIRIGANSMIFGELLTLAHGGEIEIGEWCFVGPQSRIWSAEKVIIGDRVLISHQVNIHDTNSHPLDSLERAKQAKAILTTGHPKDIKSVRSAPIYIGSDAWIGFGATIFKGVRIGARAVIGAGSIVRTDVPDDGMVIAAYDTSNLRSSAHDSTVETQAISARQ